MQWIRVKACRSPRKKCRPSCFALVLQNANTTGIVYKLLIKWQCGARIWFMARQRDTQATVRKSVRVGTTAHWKIIKQTIKDGRRPPPNDLWQQIKCEKELHEMRGQSYTTAEKENATYMGRWEVRQPLYSRLVVFIYHWARAKQKWHQVSHQSPITKWQKGKVGKLCQ